MSVGTNLQGAGSADYIYSFATAYRSLLRFGIHRILASYRTGLTKWLTLSSHTLYGGDSTTGPFG